MKKHWSHHVSRVRSSIICAIVVMSQCSPTVLADQVDGSDALKDALRQREASAAKVLAGVWVPRLGGESHYDTGSGGSQIVAETELSLDDLEPIANIELSLQKDDLALHISGFDFSVSNRGAFDARPAGIGPQQFGALTLSDGDPIRADFDFTSAAVELQFLDFGLVDEAMLDDPDLTMTLSPTIGARWISIDQSISAAIGSEDADAGWLGFLIGASMETEWVIDADAPWLQRVTFDVALAIGPAIGGDGGFLWQVRTGIELGITAQFGVYFGYRLVEVDLKSDDFDVEAGLQGLFLAGSIRF